MSVSVKMYERHCRVWFPLLFDIHRSALDVLALHMDLQPVVNHAVLDGCREVATVREPHLLHHVAAARLKYPTHLKTF